MPGLLLPLLLTALPDGGVLLARPVALSADHLQVLNKEHRAVYSGHAKAVRDTTTLTCDALEVQYEAGQDVTRIIARGSVEAVDGERWARGNEAVYENATGVLTIHGQPQARQGKRTVEGEEVVFTTGTDTLVVTQARTRVEDEQAPGAEARLSIDADTLTLESAKAQAVWRGHVRARRGPTLLLAPELTAHYDEGGAISRVEARGGVEVTERDRWARGQRADYEVRSGVLVVTGRPEARQGKSHLKGTRVTFRSGADVIEVEHATTVIAVDRSTKK